MGGYRGVDRETGALFHGTRCLFKQGIQPTVTVLSGSRERVVLNTVTPLSFKRGENSNDRGCSMTAPITHLGRNVSIGKNVRIWHFTYIGDNTVIGDNTKIGSLVHIDYDVQIGRDCKIEGMAYIPPLTRIGDRVFVGPGVVFTNDPYPMSPKMVGVQVESDVIIGAGAVLKAGVHVGAHAVVGMGAVVTKDVPPETVVYGNPARVQYSRTDYVTKKTHWNED